MPQHAVLLQDSTSMFCFISLARKPVHDCVYQGLRRHALLVTTASTSGGFWSGNMAVCVALHFLLGMHVAWEIMQASRLRMSRGRLFCFEPFVLCPQVCLGCCPSWNSGILSVSSGCRSSKPQGTVVSATVARKRQWNWTAR